jgi:hypothetical protein
MGYLNTLHVEHASMRVNEVEKVSHEAPSASAHLVANWGISRVLFWV